MKAESVYFKNGISFNDITIFDHVFYNFVADFFTAVPSQNSNSEPER